MTYNSAHDIAACLDSLERATDIALEVVVVDNASADETCQMVEQRTAPAHLSLTLIKSAQNRGFAAGVNIGLKALLSRTELDRFWILNPDCISPPHTPAALSRHPMPFSLLGCRITYADPSDVIQIDAGTVNRWTGVTGNINLGKSAKKTPPPDATKADFISGASMVASRQFIEGAGLMPEDYFLYYEEVDWATRRGSLPLAFCASAQVAHTAGASIGSPTLSRGPSAVSVYFKHRARLRFVRRHRPIALPIAYLFGWGKIAQSLWRGQTFAALSAFRAIHALPPSAAVLRAVSARPQANANALTARTKLS